MNVQGTKKLYIIKTCEQILSVNSIKHYIQFQYNCTGWGLGVGHFPPISVQIHPAVCFLPWPICVICTILFQAWSKVLSPISNLAGLALQSQNMMRAATQENAFGLCVTQRVLLKTGWSLKAYSLYTVHISLYIWLFQIRKYTYITYDYLF